MYEYKYTTVSILGGKLGIELSGTYSKSYRKDGRRYADFGFPYSLLFTLTMPYEKSLYKLAIKDAELVGQLSSKSYRLPDTESDDVMDPRIQTYFSEMDGRFLVASLGAITSDKYEYENFILRATVQVYEDKDNFDEKKIEVMLETDFGKEYRSDTFDKMMGV
jgi:hypothetical protein